MTVVAHLSDPHLDQGERARARFRRVVDHVVAAARSIDVALVTGDIADHGHAAEYAEARDGVERITAAGTEVLVLPGNHDDRAAFTQVLLGGDASTAPINHLHHVGGTAFVLVDSTIPGRDDGELDDTTVQWLRSALARTAGTPTVVAMHHPPVGVGHPTVDDTILRNPADLADLLEQAPHVRAVLTGHAHTGMASTFAGRPVRGAPGITSTLRLPWEPAADAEPRLVDRSAPPGLAYHVLDGERFVSHVRALA